MAHPKQEEVRQRYRRCCGYCGVSEVDAGGLLTVDHYRPVALGGDESDDNLIYACFKCNQYKGDFYPSMADKAQARRVLHPLRDDVASHIRANERTGEMEAVTVTGRFHIALLQLNRPALVAFRVRRRLAELLAVKQHLLEEEVARLRATIAEQETYIGLLRRLLGWPLE